MSDEWISISAYARARNITIQAVSQQIKRPTYQTLHDDGHIRKEGHSILLDETAVAALDEGRPARVVVERIQQNEELENLRVKYAALQNQYTARMEYFTTRLDELSKKNESLYEQQLQLADQSRHITDMTRQIETLNSQVDTKEQERVELSNRLVKVEKDAEELSVRLETAEQERNALTEKLKDAEETTADLTTRLNAAAATESSLRSDMEKSTLALTEAREQAAGERERMMKEMEDLRSQLETEKKKTWWQKLWGR